MATVQFHNIGIRDYKDTWDFQEQLFNEVLLAKRADVPDAPNHLIFCQHPHVYTLGRSGDEQNLLVNYIQLQAKHAQFHKINRGGDITYHGPGQLVGYPILDLENFGMGLRPYIYSIEEAIIQVLAKYVISASRDSDATGVWLDAGLPTARKICAIGVKSSRYVTMHGFALNVNTDLDYFRYINPCGFVDKGVTSMEKELGRTLDFDQVKRAVLDCFLSVFDVQIGF